MTNRCGYAVILGRPNAGKSTLLNRILGQKLVITSRKPQTTRHSIRGIKTLDGGQIVYVDTPGIHQRGDRAMNRYLNRAARTAVHDVDVKIMVVEAMRWTEEDKAVLEVARSTRQPVFLIVNKVDRVQPKEILLPYLEERSAEFEYAGVFPISAKTGSGVADLERAVLAIMPESENIFEEDEITDRSERFFAAELVREQLMRRYSAEIPYALTVEIERFEVEGEMYRIGALIWVEKDSQKGIIVGKGGEALKDVGTRARMEMERFFQRKVFLELWVRVKESWSSDQTTLARLGYSE